MSVSIKVEGFRELEKALSDLNQSTAKGVVRRALKKSAEPVAQRMRDLAPEDDGDLRKSIGISSRLSKRQKGQHRRLFASSSSSVEMYLGAGPLPQAHLQEFGTFYQPPQPFARPAWDAGKEMVLVRLKGILGDEILKTAQRAARRAAKLAKGGR